MAIRDLPSIDTSSLPLPARNVPAVAESLVRTEPPPDIKRALRWTTCGGRQPSIVSRWIPSCRRIPPADLVPHLGRSVPPRMAAAFSPRTRLYPIEALCTRRRGDQVDDADPSCRGSGRHLSRRGAFMGWRTISHTAGGVEIARPVRGTHDVGQPRWFVPAMAPMGPRSEARRGSRHVGGSGFSRAGP